MPKLYSSAQILFVLKNNGFYFVTKKGSHIKYRKNSNPVLTFIIPADRKEISIGTFNSIVRQSGLSKSVFG